MSQTLLGIFLQDNSKTAGGKKKINIILLNHTQLCIIKLCVFLK